MCMNNASNNCTTCTRLANDPYRRHDAAGKLYEACCDKIHRPFLMPGSEHLRMMDKLQAHLKQNGASK